MANSNATYNTSITVDMPDFTSSTVTFTNTAYFTSGNNEILPGKQYSLTLDSNGQGTQVLPCPDNDGTTAVNWRINLPSNESITAAISYSASSQALSDILASASTTTDPDSITASLATKANKVTGATVGDLAYLDSDGDLVDTGLPYGGAYTSDQQLINWAGQLPQLMTSVTRTDYSDSIECGWIQVTGTVTWPDGATGHLDGGEYPDQLGVLQWFTASHATSGKIVVQDLLENGVAGLTVITPDYYVDSSASGDGTLATPYATLAEATPSNGEIVAIKSGSTFAETLTPVAGVGYYRYASGNKPILDAGVTFTAGSWAKTAGRTNVYEQTVTVELHVSSSFVNVQEDSVLLKRVADVATCDSTAGSTVSSVDTGSGNTSVTIYVHTTNSDDPTSNGSTYRYTRLLYGIDGIDIDSVVIDGIHTRLQSSNNGSMRVGGDSTIRNCRAQYGGKHNMFASGGSLVLGCVMDEAEYNSTWSHLVFNEDTPTSADDITVKCCAMTMATLDTSASGLNHHKNVSGTFGDVLVYRMYTSGMGSAAYSDDVDCTSATLRKCYSLNDTRFCSWTAFSGGLIDNCGIKTNVANARLISESAAGTLTVRGGYLWAANNVNGGMFYTTAAGTYVFVDVLFYNTSSNNTKLAIFANNASLTLRVNNCKFKFANTPFAYITSAALSVYTANQNQFDTDDDFTIDGNAYASVALYIAGTGQDAAASIGGVDVSRATG